ncbi:hypothetical protein [Pseudomonas sp. RIT-PI-AD]|uniref:hypothetical protein n=1 Tax=Pseudomonas sp. RIT-PI-AD TaxID=3035294 RepID=UPI0021DAA4DB|nr:hypothetical protein [Pseudomonas sp. RIT-PI-AD]
MQNEASIFWPSSHRHYISSLRLEVKESGLSQQTLALIPLLLKIVDAMRDLESLPFALVNELDALRKRAATALERIADSLQDPASVKNLRLRAEILRGSDHKALSQEIMLAQEQELIVVCGRLCTWLGKSSSYYSSALFAVPDRASQRISDSVDAVLPAAFEQVQALFRQPLELRRCYPLQWAKLIAAAGEANLYPKHFAYFLPEDEGAKYSPNKRSLVFINTYQALFNLITQEESTNHLYLHDAELCMAEIPTYLVAWFRGHDLGHSILREQTDFRELNKVDRWGSMQLQEALADSFGLLLCNTAAWRERLGIRSGMLSMVFVLEMLRYLRRDPCSFPDAGAAFIELQFLIQNGYADIDRPTRKISTSSERLMAGIAALVDALSDSVLANDLPATLAFIERYAPHRNEEALDELMQLLGHSSHTLDYVQPIFHCASQAGMLP